MHERRRDWDLEYDGAAPPLPRDLKRNPNIEKRDDETWAEAIQNILPEGAYFILFEPDIARSKDIKTPKVFAGVLRIDHEIKEKRERREPEKKEGNKGSKVLVSHGSGDLYSLPRSHTERLSQGLLSKDLTVDNLEKLQFPAEDYRYYLSLQSLWLTGEDTLLLGFDTHHFDDRQGWQRQQSIMFSFKKKNIKRPFYCGTALNNWKTNIGSVSLRQVAKALRCATIEVHTTPGVTENNLVEKLKEENTLAAYLEATGWSLKIKEPEDEESEPSNTETEGSPRLVDVLRSLDRAVRALNQGVATGDLSGEQGQVEDRTGETWTPYKLRAYHRKNFRDSKGPFTEPWKYHLLLVDKIDIDGDNPRGLMYDSSTGNRRDAPRQGAAIAVGSTGRPDPKRLLSTALHELGHMQGLYHNPTHPGLMQPSEYREKDFVPVDHAKIDTFRLRHLPDLWVRPGGVPFGYLYRGSAIEVLDLVPETDGLRLTMEPAEACAGEAPEIVLKLTNWSGRDILCPNERTAQLSNGRLGLILHTPSGRRQEISPVHYPRRLRGLGSTSLLLGETLELRIRWDRDQLPCEAGLYRIEAHLLWIVSKDDENNETDRDTEKASSAMPYRASTKEGILRVL